jgi:hypothetical protein
MHRDARDFLLVTFTLRPVFALGATAFACATAFAATFTTERFATPAGFTTALSSAGLRKRFGF